MNTRRSATTALLALALLGLCGASILTVYGSYRALERSGLTVALGNQNERAEVEATTRIEADLPRKIVIELSAGDVRIAVGPDDSIEMKERREAWEGDAAAAQRAADAMSLEQRRDGDTLFLSWNVTERFIVGDRGGPDAIHIDLQLPADIEVSVRSGQGAIEIEGLAAPVEARVDFGSIQLKGLRASTTASSQNGSLVARDIQAGGGDIRLSSEHGTVEAEGLAGTKIGLMSRGGQLDARDLKASESLAIESEFGSMDVANFVAEGMTATARSGAMQLREGQVAKTLEIEGGFGEIELDRVAAGRYAIRSETGSVGVFGASGPLAIEIEFGDLRIEAAEAVELDLVTRKGSVDFEGSLKSGVAHRVESEFGDIQLSLPADADLDIRLETEFGSLSSALPIEREGANDRNHLAGRLNRGGTELRAKTNTGSIRLDVLAGAASDSALESDSPAESASPSEDE